MISLVLAAATQASAAAQPLPAMATAPLEAWSQTSTVRARPKLRYDTSGIDTDLKRQCADGSFSGVVVVRAGGQEVYSGACGEADPVNHIANTRQTRFKIYSTSKFVTALTVMRLVEQGRLALAAPLSRYVNDVPVAWKAVTMRQLLQHTSGIKDLTPSLLEAFHTDYDSAMRTTLATLKPDQTALDAPPGSQFAYNNFGFELLATAVERATGEPFPAVAEALVLKPAEMRTASFQPTTILMGHLVDAPEDGLALGFNGAPDKLVQATSWAFVQMGAGAIRANADDFVSLDQALTAGRIVSRQTLQEMARDPVSPPADYPAKGRRFGLGMFVTVVQGVTLEGHTGGTNGYISDFERAPADGAMMVALTNRGFSPTGWLRTDFAEMLKAARAPL